jgi:hypothetical protein
MILHQLSHLNWGAVVAATFVAFAIGSVYYMPQVMGDRWAAVVAGYTGRDVKELSGNPVPSALAQWLAGMFVCATVFAMVVRAGGADSVGSGIVLGIVLWAGFGATFSSWPAIFAKQPWSLWAINNVVFVLMLVAAGAILGGWH